MGDDDDKRHVGHGTVGGNAQGGDLDVRPRSAGVEAVQQIALTKWERATLPKRVRGFDAVECTGCGGRMRLIAVIKDGAVIERICKHIGEDARGRWFARGRDPCEPWA
ncbi:MAG: hypothetical protein U0325_36035 [Polyangiales bacterium]